MKSTSPMRALIVGGLTVGLALALGYWLGSRSESTPGTVAATNTAGDDEILYWYDPMVPDQHFDKPGKSPFMDMQLVPKRANASASAGVQVEPGLRQSLGIRTAVVEVGTGTAAEVIAPGTLQWDLRGERRISSRVEGYVEQVFVRAPFERVRAGQPLASILAPRLATAMAEYRALKSAGSPEARAIGDAARARLRLLGLSDADVRASTKGVPQVVLRAPADGVLAEISVRAGDNVMAGQSLFRLNATDRIWLEARLPQASAGSVAPGARVDVRVSSFPGETFHGTIESLLPELDPQTRTQTARIVLENADGRMAAGMFAEAVLHTTDATRRAWIPSEALIMTGRDSRVIVAHANGSFHPVRVRTGRQAAGRTEILEGLKGGERVVVSGQFLLDSEASLSGALQRLGDSKDKP